MLKSVSAKCSNYYMRAVTAQRVTDRETGSDTKREREREREREKERERERERERSTLIIVFCRYSVKMKLSENINSPLIV